MLIFWDYLRAWGIALIVFLAIDLVWLGYIAKDYYRKHLKQHIVKEFDWRPAAVFYSLFMIGLVYFAIGPAIREDSLRDALVDGAAYGFFTYVTYQLTNLAVVKNWPRGQVAVDILWGTFLCASVSITSFSLFFILFR